MLKKLMGGNLYLIGLFITLAFFVSIPGIGISPSNAAREVADIVLYNGKILTVDKKFTIAQAVAINKDRIIAVGTSKQILALEKKGKTERVNLKGKTVVPGLIESHAHLQEAAESDYLEKLPTPDSVDTLLKYVAEKVKTLKEGEWIVFEKTFPTRFKELRFPTLEELNEVAPKNPIVIDGLYAGQANSYAMKIAGVDKNTPQPKVGVIVKDPATGELTGRFLRCQELILKHYPGMRKLTHEDRMDAIRKLVARYNQLGFTSVIEGLTHENGIAAYNELYNRGELGVRMTYTCAPDIVKKSKEEIINQVKAMQQLVKTPDTWGKIGHVKSFIDGGILTGTARMREPYGAKGPLHKKVYGHKDSDFKGVVIFDQATYDKLAEVAYELNIPMTAHCVGDGALDVLLGAYKKVDAVHSIKGRRFAVTHGDFTPEDSLQWMADHGVVVIGQVAWLYKDGALLSQVLTERTIKTFYPFKTMERLGVVTSGGSDLMIKWDPVKAVNPYHPWLAMHTIVTRQVENDGVLVPEERISRESALRQYTINGAYVSFSEGFKGSIEVGKAADLAVLNKDYLTCPVDEIKEIYSLRTIVGGKTVHMTRE
ncbi:MAG TPA: amidohydrolase [Desulfobacteraceae bacterium]|nr:amidohydrolase [Desulfobacteraceae bacterium]HPQ28506.1 amidohydrolase [Desulfobacteraceae bacterium]